MQMGRTGQLAPPLREVRWIDGSGVARAPVSLGDLGDGYRILYFFQHWCPGCHSHGFPTLVKLVAELAKEGVGFAAIQTVFEGSEVNTFERIRDDQQRYGLAIPFGHASPARGTALPAPIADYRTGGTPWFVVIAPDGKVVFDGFQLDSEALIKALRLEAA
jgi:thiol-disulfide isomerase/thioredoxin